MEHKNEYIAFPELQREMERHRHSMSDLAERIRCKERILRKWLSNKSSIEVYYAVQIAKVYDRPIEELFLKEEGR